MRFLPTFVPSFARTAVLAVAVMAPVAVLHAQTAPPVLPALERALAGGRAADLAPLLADRVEVSLPSGSGVYSRAQAPFVLERFFDESPPRRFRIDHRMAAGRAYFVSGRYDADDGTSMTVQVRLALDGDTWTVRTLRIDAARLE